MKALMSRGGALAFALGLGMISIPPAQGQALTFNLLHTLDGSPDGSQPEAASFRDGHGNLFGTGASGGDENCNSPSGCGTVFEVNTSGQFTVLYTFQGSSDGNFPYGGVTGDSAGNLYGTTWGSNGGAATLWELAPSGTKTILWTFDFKTGAAPNSAPVFDTKGNLRYYGANATKGRSGQNDTDIPPLAP